MEAINLRTNSAGRLNPDLALIGRGEKRVETKGKSRTALFRRLYDLDNWVMSGVCLVPHPPAQL